MSYVYSQERMLHLCREVGPPLGRLSRLRLYPPRLLLLTAALLGPSLGAMPVVMCAATWGVLWAPCRGAQATRTSGRPIGTVTAVMDLKGINTPSFAFFKVCVECGVWSV
jgi:hypothetical protein